MNEAMFAGIVSAVAAAAISFVSSVWYLSKRNSEKVSEAISEIALVKVNLERDLREAKADCDRRLERLELELDDKVEILHKRINDLAHEVHEFRAENGRLLGRMEGKLDSIIQRQ